MSRKAKFFRASAVALLLLSIWIVYDLMVPVRHDLRVFDPHRVAALETDMWRSYYEHRPVALFRQLTKLLREQYHLPFWSSRVAACYAARAAVVFQKGKGREEYRKALPDLEAFYGRIRRASTTGFDVRQTAARELEWWIVHRERDRHPPGQLERTLADLQAGIYGQPAAVFAGHARARAEAMELRDARASGMTERDWARIGELLDRSWGELHGSVAFAAPPRLSYTK